MPNTAHTITHRYALSTTAHNTMAARYTPFTVISTSNIYGPDRQLQSNNSLPATAIINELSHTSTHYGPDEKRCTLAIVCQSMGVSVCYTISKSLGHCKFITKKRCDRHFRKSYPITGLPVTISTPSNHKVQVVQSAAMMIKITHSYKHYWVRDQARTYIKMYQ